MYNKEIHDITTLENLEAPDALAPSQIGVTLWSSEEKHVFFRVLQCKGRNDLESIAKAIRSKSLPEIQVYLDLLERATLKQHLYEPRQELLSHADVPGALEISEECAAALDQAAEGLSMKQENHENHAEERTHGDFWLISEERAELLNELVSASEELEAEDEPNQIYRAAEILYPSNFLELSSRLFMNSSIDEMNWTSYAELDETPSILCTAFLDFYSLVINITKRLVSSAHFFAMSRIRATDSSRYTHRKTVRKQDVIAALNVLGMATNSAQFWKGVAKRNRLDVYREAKIKTRVRLVGDALDYDEVEMLLQEPRSRASSVAPSGLEPTPSSGRKTPELELEHYSRPDRESKFGGKHDSLSGSDAQGSDTVSSSRLHQGRSRSRSRSASSKTSEDEQNRYAEAFDRAASRQEELRLWEILGREDIKEVKSEDEDLPRRPKYGVRKTKEDLSDWRDWTHYQSPWEVHDVPVPAAEFLKNERRDRNPDGILQQGRAAGRPHDTHALPDTLIIPTSKTNQEGREEDSSRRRSLVPRVRKTAMAAEKNHTSQEQAETELFSRIDRSSDSGQDEDGDESRGWNTNVAETREAHADTTLIEEES